jgi:hypothetical protein
MKTLARTTTLLTLAAAALSIWGAEPPALDPHLEPLRPLLEKTWKGEFKGSTPDKPVVDVSHWERALNGRAVRVLHSINEGLYGGEILMFWDESKQQISYCYFTTAGFTSTGTLHVENSRFITRETISGSAEGITEVRAVTELLADGSLHVKSEHYKNGQWSPGHEVTYQQEPSAKVVFR